MSEFHNPGKSSGKADGDDFPPPHKGADEVSVHPFMGPLPAPDPLHFERSNGRLKHRKVRAIDGTVEEALLEAQLGGRQ